MDANGGGGRQVRVSYQQEQRRAKSREGEVVLNGVRSSGKVVGRVR